ncbi:hypothetical protein [Actinoplanes sp. NPDC051411]|uniref:hypothetical protein n=1 Tax=Actinoplanes sp. NPDC051411 TaxID=3155522 RepID=UPI0034437E8F
MGKALAVLLAGVVGVVLVGWLFVSIIGPVLFYLVIGAIVVAGGALLYAKAKRAVAPGSRNHNRIEAAKETYRMRNR